MPRPDHLYRKLLDELRRQVRGSFAPGEALPGQRALAYMHGVGQATVHRALKTLAGEGLVRPRPRVGWVRTPSRSRPVAARGLRLGLITRRSQRELDGDSRGGPLYPALMEEAARHGAQIVLHTNPRQHHPTPARNRLELSRVPWNAFDAGLLLEVEDAVTLADPLLRSHPILAVDRDSTEFGIDSVVFDDRLCGVLAARHFHELGHRRFAVTEEVNGEGWPSEGTWMARRHGFEAEVGRLGGVIRPEWRVVVSRQGQAKPRFVVREIAAAWFERPLGERPTAFFSIERGSLKAVQQVVVARKLSIPEDLSVITCDWSPSDPPGTTFTCTRLDFAALVRRSVEIALEKAGRVRRGEWRAGREATRYLAPVLLQPGQTTAPPPEA